MGTVVRSILFCTPVIFNRNAESIGSGVLPYSPFTKAINWLEGLLYIGRPFRAHPAPARNCLRPDNLARRRHQRRQACIHPYLWNERHRLFQQVDLPQLLQLGDHIRVHASRNLRFFHQLVRLREIKIFLDRMAIKQQIILLIFPCGLDGIVKEAVDLGGKLILYGIKGSREFLSGIECWEVPCGSSIIPC